MENFFNYISKPVSPEDVDLWFRINNIYPEKMDLFYDFVISLNNLINDTYLGDDDFGNETKIKLSKEDTVKHFKWCWDKTIENFEKENFQNREEAIYSRAYHIKNASEYQLNHHGTPILLNVF